MRGGGGGDYLEGHRREHRAISMQEGAVVNSVAISLLWEAACAPVQVPDIAASLLEGSHAPTLLTCCLS